VRQPSPVSVPSLADLLRMIGGMSLPKNMGSNCACCEFQHGMGCVSHHEGFAGKDLKEAVVAYFKALSWHSQGDRTL
jgi:hypothetical protein